MLCSKNIYVFKIFFNLFSVTAAILDVGWESQLVLEQNHHHSHINYKCSLVQNFLLSNIRATVLQASCKWLLLIFYVCFVQRYVFKIFFILFSVTAGILDGRWETKPPMDHHSHVRCRLVTSKVSPLKHKSYGSAGKL